MAGHGRDLRGCGLVGSPLGNVHDSVWVEKRIHPTRVGLEKAASATSDIGGFSRLCSGQVLALLVHFLYDVVGNALGRIFFLLFFGLWVLALPKLCFVGEPVDHGLHKGPKPGHEPGVDVSFHVIDQESPESLSHGRFSFGSAVFRAGAVAVFAAREVFAAAVQVDVSVAALFVKALLEDPGQLLLLLVAAGIVAFWKTQRRSCGRSSSSSSPIVQGLNELLRERIC